MNYLETAETIATMLTENFGTPDAALSRTDKKASVRFWNTNNPLVKITLSTSKKLEQIELNVGVATQERPDYFMRLADVQQTNATALPPLSRAGTFNNVYLTADNPQRFAVELCAKFTPA